MIEFEVHVIDDEASIRQGVTFGLKKLYKVASYSLAEDALDAYANETPDLVLLDIGLPGMSGLEALQKIKELDPEVIVIMITAYEDVSTVITAMKSGAYDYVTKPVHMDSLKMTLKNALETIRMRKTIQALQEESLKENIPCIVGESNVIQDLMQFVDKVAKSPDTPVLITGESGTGKELIAGAIHFKSPNFRGPFITINCAAINKNLIESELFGYEKGAFSGAAPSGKAGLIEQASGGTLFLDEVGDLSANAQATLLRFLEHGEYYKVGGTKKLKAKTRILSATNKNLKEMVEEGEFRLDLFYRLAVINVEIPSLNDRREDILLIANHFLLEFSQKMGKPLMRLSKEAEVKLKNYPWEGNIRELRNLMEKGVIIGAGEELTSKDLGLLPSGQAMPAPTPSPQEETSGFPPLPDEGIDLDMMEAHYIKEALKKTNGNDAKAAELLNMTYYSFRYRKKKRLST